jgi:hypothetical protein
VICFHVFWPINVIKNYHSTEESYECLCLIICDLETSKTRRPRLELGCCATEKKTKCYLYKLLHTSTLLHFTKSILSTFRWRCMFLQLHPFFKLRSFYIRANVITILARAQVKLTLWNNLFNYSSHGLRTVNIRLFIYLFHTTMTTKDNYWQNL